MKTNPLLCILLAVMLSGCSLFKKVTKEKEIERNKSEVSVQTATNIQQSDVEKGSVKNNKITIGGTTIYPTKGTESSVDSKGNFKGQADSVKTGYKETDMSQFDFSKHTERSVNMLTDSIAKQSTIKKASSSESTTDWKLYIFIFVIIGIVGLVFWLRFR